MGKYAPFGQGKAVERTSRHSVTKKARSMNAPVVPNSRCLLQKRQRNMHFRMVPLYLCDLRRLPDEAQHFPVMGPFVPCWNECSECTPSRALRARSFPEFSLSGDLEKKSFWCGYGRGLRCILSTGACRIFHRLETCLTLLVNYMISGLKDVP